LSCTENECLHFFKPPLGRRRPTLRTALSVRLNSATLLAARIPCGRKASRPRPTRLRRSFQSRLASAAEFLVPPWVIADNFVAPGLSNQSRNRSIAWPIRPESVDSPRAWSPRCAPQGRPTGGRRRTSSFSKRARATRRGWNSKRADSISTYKADLFRPGFPS